MKEFMKQIPSLECVFRTYLSEQLVTVKHKSPTVPQLQNLGEMKVVAIILHKNHAAEIGFCPPDADQDDYIEYYPIADIEISWEQAEVVKVNG